MEKVSGLVFEGYFTPEIRKRIREIRAQLGITQKAMAEYLDVSLETLKNWEQGHHPSCLPGHVPVIQKLLEGKLEKKIAVLHAYQLTHREFLKKAPYKLRMQYALAMKLAAYKETGGEVVRVLQEILRRMLS